MALGQAGQRPVAGDRARRRLPLRSRTPAAVEGFCDEVRDACLSLGVDLAILLGALLADVPHTRPVRISGGAATAELAALAGLEPSYYEGPTGILGVVGDALGRAAIPTVSLWASVPHYVSQSTSPKATLALVERSARLLATSVDVVELQIASGGLRTPDQRAGGVGRRRHGVREPSRGAGRRSLLGRGRTNPWSTRAPA